jgi:hypothetical protein
MGALKIRQRPDEKVQAEIIGGGNTQGAARLRLHLVERFRRGLGLFGHTQAGIVEAPAFLGEGEGPGAAVDELRIQAALEC